MAWPSHASMGTVTDLAMDPAAINRCRVRNLYTRSTGLPAGHPAYDVHTASDREDKGESPARDGLSGTAQYIGNRG